MAVALGAGVALLLAAALWLFDRAGAVYTSDARVHANMATIASSVAGRIAAIPVSAGQAVEAGQTLAQLDDREAPLQVAALVLELEAAEGEVAREMLRAGIAHKKAGMPIRREATASARARPLSPLLAPT
jgi:multidrug resistance efflux pump